MTKFIACLVAVAAISLTAQESQAQFYGGRGISIGIGGGGFGGGGFGGYGGRGFGSPYYGGRSFGVSSFNRGFGGGGYYSPRYVARPVYYGGGSNFYRGGGGYYRGGGGCGY